MRLNSLRLKYALLSAAIFSVGFVGATFLSRMVVSSAVDEAIRKEVATSASLANDAIAEMTKRVGTYAELLARKQALAEVVYKGTDNERASYFADEFDALKALDPTISVMEATNLIGTVIARGHDPKRIGDDKSKLREVDSAINGKSMTGLTVSPSSGQASFNAVVPIKNSRGGVGTLAVGARATEAFVIQIKQRAHADVITLFNG